MARAPDPEQCHHPDASAVAVDRMVVDDLEPAAIAAGPWNHPVTITSVAHPVSVLELDGRLDLGLAHPSSTKAVTCVIRPLDLPDHFPAADPAARYVGAQIPTDRIQIPAFRITTVPQARPFVALFAMVSGRKAVYFAL